MATRPPKSRTRTAARKAAPKTAVRKSPAKASARKKTAAPSRTSAAALEAARAAMRAALAALVRPTRPRAASITCATVPKKTSGTVEYDYAATMTTPQVVLLCCYGSGFGTGVPVDYTKTATGWTFAGSRLFCHIKKCSDGTASTDTVSIAGTLGSNGQIAFTYEVLVYCGAALVCQENGSYKGQKIGPSPDLFDAEFRGTTNWTLTCCPDPVWAYAINPPPKLPPGGRYIEPGRSGRKRTVK